jgi:hypothetical protein
MRDVEPPLQAAVKRHLTPLDARKTLACSRTTFTGSKLASETRKVKHHGRIEVFADP